MKSQNTGVRSTSEENTEVRLSLDLCDVAGKVFKGKDGVAKVPIKWMRLDLHRVDLQQLSKHCGISPESLLDLAEVGDIPAHHSFITDEERRAIIDGVAALIKEQPYAIIKLRNSDDWGLV
jgi:hypothetical protein